MTMDDYLGSRTISTPLRMVDCDVHSEASTAVVLPPVVDTARDGPHSQIRIEAMGATLH